MSSPSTPDPHNLPARRPGLWWRGARWLAFLVLVALSLAVLAWLTLHWGILPRIEQWRPQIEQRAGAALGQPVRIGAIRVQSSSWIPAFELRDVQVLDKAGNPALALGLVRVALAPQSLLALELRLAQLHVDGVQLDVRRDLDGRLHVAGMDMQSEFSASADDGAAADWLFSQYEIVVRQGVIRWTDELRGAPPLELRQVDVVLRNGLRRHDLRLDATPPPSWGERFSLRGLFTQSLLARRGDWRRWSGTLYGDLPAADVAALRTYVNLPFELVEGRGAARTWIDVQAGHWRAMTADLALADVALRMGPKLQPLALSQLGVRMRAKRDATSVEFAAEGLQFTTGEGVVWPSADVSLALQQAQTLDDADMVTGADATAPVTGGRLRASRLDLALMAMLASRLPIGAAAEKALAELAPVGVASALDLSWQGPFEAPTRYRAQGKMAGLGLAPLPAPPVARAASAADVPIGRPGLQGADIEFEASESGGKARLAMAGGALQFPGVFEQPKIPLDKLAARFEWRVQTAPDGTPPGLELKVVEAQFANADAQGDLQATWRTGKTPGYGPGARLPGEIELGGRIVRARADRVAAYLPLGIPASARHYVARSIRSGTAESGSFAVKGDIWRFPFQGMREGLFKVTAKVRDVRFDYLPSVPDGSDEPAWESPWPGFSAVQGDLVFDRTGLQLDGVQARLWGVQMRNVKARIDDLAADKPLLQIDGEARGPASDLLRFVADSPVGGWVGGGLSQMSASGLADLKLGLSIPLAETAQTAVRGSLTLAGSDVRIRAGMPLLGGARGRVDFTQRGFTIVGASARTLGGDASFEGGTQADGSMRFTGQGTVTAEALKRAGELAPLPALASQLRGQASYKLALGIVPGGAELSVSSDLVGLESNWPAPMNKPAATAWPLRWQTALVPGNPKTPEGARDTLRFDLGPVLQARLLRDVSGEGTRILSGGVGIGEAAPVSTNGVQVRMTVPVLDADAWMRVWQRLPDQATDGVELPSARVTLRAAQLVAAERRLSRAEIDLQHDPKAVDAPWQGQVQAEQLAGRLSWRGPAGPADPGRLGARLTRLALPPSESVDVEQLLDRAPLRMPALDVVIDDFEYRGRKLGRLEVQAVSRPSALRAGAREWRMDKFDLVVPEAHLQASGTWAPAAVAGGTRRMSMDFAIDLADSGKLASRFGWSEAVRGGKGRMQGQLAWDGAPLAPDFNSMEGQVNVALASGQFLRAEPGVGRLLGILSLQSLPRRLLLDFRDVFQEGFAFDNVDADVSVSRGRATTKNLRMRGLQAVVLMEGTADLVRETQDLHVLIVPEVNAGAASLAYAAINPAIALGTFLAQMVLREPLRAAGTREFRITGPLAEHKVERIERGAAAAPSMRAPPAASAASAPVLVEPRRKDPAP
jgi:uncharacterized protein (TIGR02099 family)